jgi:hypothetical protein
MNIIISKEIEDKFRLMVGQKLGSRKGNIKLAIEDAFKDWIAKQEKVV